MNDRPPKTVWPGLVYDDAHAALRLLVDVFGFEERLVVPHEPTGGVAHAQLAWPEGGGVMLGTAGREDSPTSLRPLGGSGVYVVTDSPDELWARVVEAGCTVVQGLRDEHYGSRGFTIQDHEGNFWTFGTYRGE